MKHELEQRIVERWPDWFDVHGSIQSTLMPFGFEHSDGWFDIIWRLCEHLEPLVAQFERESGLEFKVLQVKEKFGGLRFYSNFSDEAISHVIRDAEAESLKTCEVCGKPGKPNRGGWIKTCCAEHRPEDVEDQEF
jgi:hypothetical protein